MENKLGNLIKELRKGKGLSQMAIAEELFISFQAVSLWEKGVNIPNDYIILKLAKIFDVEPKILFDAKPIKQTKIREKEIKNESELSFLDKKITNADKAISRYNLKSYGLDEFSSEMFDFENEYTKNSDSTILTKSKNSDLSCEKYYEDEKIHLFYLSLNGISMEKAKYLLQRSIEDDKHAFFAILMNFLGIEEIFYYAFYLLKLKKLDFLCILAKIMPRDALDIFKNTALDEENIDLHILI